MQTRKHFRKTAYKCRWLFVLLQGEISAGGGGGGAVPEPNRDFSNPMYDMQSGSSGSAVSSTPEPATLAVTPPTHRELNPVTIDTGKDTQRLVEDDSEC